MDHLVTNNVYELLKKYSSVSEETDVAIGVRPSGTVHLGNMVTLGLAAIISRDIGPHISQVNLTICDLDLPDIKDWPVKERGYLKYFKDLPDLSGRHPNLLSRSLNGIEELCRGLESQLGIKFDIRLLSQVQREKGFREGLKRVLDYPGIMRFLDPSPDKSLGDRVLVYPLCKVCGTSNPVPSEYSNGRLITSCSNPECDIENYEVEVDDLGRDIAVHYFIDPLRDTIEPNSKIHVFGGDYRVNSGRGVTKLEKILEVMKIANEAGIPDIFVGPLFYARDGSKMSKSKDNGLTLERLKGHFGSQRYAERLVKFAEYLVTEGYNHVDYPLVEKQLLT